MHLFFPFVKWNIFEEKNCEVEYGYLILRACEVTASAAGADFLFPLDFDLQAVDNLTPVLGQNASYFQELSILLLIYIFLFYLSLQTVYLPVVHVFFPLMLSAP